MAPAGAHSSSGSRNSAGKKATKATKARVPPSFNSIKSLPAEIRLMESSPAEKSGLSNSNGNLEERVGNVAEQGDQVIDDSPYGERAVPVLDEDFDVVSSPSPSIPSIAESKWNDTASYAKKKVFASSFYCFTSMSYVFVLSGLC